MARVNGAVDVMNKHTSRSVSNSRGHRAGMEWCRCMRSLVRSLPAELAPHRRNDARDTERL